jgi:hypothetical protein
MRTGSKPASAAGKLTCTTLFGSGAAAVGVAIRHALTTQKLATTRTSCAVDLENRIATPQK